MADRDPKMDPQPGDVFHKWDQNFLVDRVTQGCIFSKPSLSAHKNWVGVLYFRAWAASAEVVLNAA